MGTHRGAVAKEAVRKEQGPDKQDDGQEHTRPLGVSTHRYIRASLRWREIVRYRQRQGADPPRRSHPTLHHHLQHVRHDADIQ